MKRPMIRGRSVPTPGPGAPIVGVGRVDQTPGSDDDPDEAIEAAISVLTDSGDIDRALAFIYSAIAGEGRIVSGLVNPLYLQSAALRLGRGDIATALTYLEFARGSDDHAPDRDPQAFRVLATGAPFVPAWPLTMATGALAVTLGAWLVGRLRRLGSVPS